jgi:hypothetical protein
LEITLKVQPGLFGSEELGRKANISGGVADSFPGQKGQSLLSRLLGALEKSEGLLPLSVEMITHLPMMGSFLSSGISFLPPSSKLQIKPFPLY